jgi:polysaccharide export outer membrane protein
VSRPLLVLSAVASLALTAPVLAQAPAAGLQLGAKDLLRIKVAEVPELNVESRISDSGKISLPLIGEVVAAGMTDAEFAARLERLLEERYVNAATVAVEVVEYRSRPITFLGAVARPGAVALAGRWTLMDALAAAGGLSTDHGGEIVILRRADNGLTDQLAIRVDDLFVRGRPEANVPVRANDLIQVKPRTQVSIYCLGEVRTPGAVTFQSTERITLLGVLARAGGLTDRASKKIRVRRRTGDVLGEEIVVDYAKVLAGKAPDLALAEGDMVVVKESLF